MTSTVMTAAVDVARLEPRRGSRLVAGAGAFAAVGLLAAVAAAVADPNRFGYAYLAGFLWTVSIGLGALFFVLIQHLTRAGWSVAARRQAEWLSGVLPLALVLFVPLALLGSHIWPWMGHEAHDPAVEAKAAWLNPGFFYARAAVYLAVWAGLAVLFARLSRRQDDSGDAAFTARMQLYSAPATIAFGLTVTLAAFDWIMSLTPHWFSTIFGVYFFAGCAVAGFAALSLSTIALQQTGLLSRVSSVEHRHDVGKLLFGFTVFWAYIAFSQFMLIWYANIPEETVWYLARWEGAWKPVSLSLLFLHFLVPFAVLLPRAAKRSPVVLGSAAALLLVMHYVDIFWLVLPVLDPAGARFGWVELAGWAGPAGVLAVWVSWRVAHDPLYPLRDPRLGEAVRAENA